VPSGQAAAVKTKGAVSTVGGAITRMNEALAAAGFSDVQARISAEQGRIEIVDAQGRAVTVSEDSSGTPSTTAEDLGLVVGPQTGTLNGDRVLAGLNTSLVRSLNGGRGFDGDGVVNFTLRDGSSFSVTLNANTTVTDVISQIEGASGTTAG